MSSPLALAAVSSALRDLLQRGLCGALGPGVDVQVTTCAPGPTDATNLRRVHLFLHRVVPAAGRRNLLPAPHGRAGDPPPLPLELEYVLTASGPGELEREILLGRAMAILHRHPVLDPGALGAALERLPDPAAAAAPADPGEQPAEIRIAAGAWTGQDGSALFSALGVPPRPVVTYTVTGAAISGATVTAPAERELQDEAGALRRAGAPRPGVA